MKNKKMLYLLISGTLIVWGLIIYKIFNNMQGEENPTVQQHFVAAAASGTISDTFSIDPTYRDPFLGKSLSRKDPSEQPAPVIRSSIPPPVKQPTAWPAIYYSGVIKNQQSNKQMVLLQIDGREYMLKIGEAINGVQLVNVFRDSVEVHFSKEKKFIHK